jgi:hypothetical protein
MTDIDKTGNTVNLTVPIRYVEWVSIGKKGAELFFDADAIPKAWDVSSLTVDLETAIDAAAKIAQNWSADE